MAKDDSMKATPRNKALGVLSDAFRAADEFAGNPFGYQNPPGRILSSLAGIPDIAKTLDRLSYGEPLTVGSGMTTKPRDETANAAMALAPLVGPAARGALKLGAGALSRIAEAAPSPLAGSLAAQRGAMLIPIKLTADKVKIPSIMKDMRAGLGRQELFEKYGAFPLTDSADDIVTHMQIPPEARLTPTATQGYSASTLSENIAHPALYSAVPDLADLAVLRKTGPRGATSENPGLYFGRTTGRLLPPTGYDTPGARGVEAIALEAGPHTTHSIKSLWNDLGPSSPWSDLPKGQGRLLDHEVNHALAARANGSMTDPATTDWHNRLHEISATIGSQDVPTPRIIEQYDELIPLANMRRAELQRFDTPMIGSPADKQRALGVLRGQSDEVVSDELRKLIEVDGDIKLPSAQGYAQGGPVNKPQGMKHTKPTAGALSRVAVSGQQGFADGGAVRNAVNAAVGGTGLVKAVGNAQKAVGSIAAGNGSLGDLNSLHQMAAQLGYTAPGLSQAMGLLGVAKAGYNMATDPTGTNAAKFAAKVNPIAAQALSLYKMATDAEPADAANFIVGFHPLLRAYNGLADAFGFANIGQLAANLTKIGDPEAPAQLRDTFSNNPNSDALTRTVNDIVQRTGEDSMDTLMGVTGAFGTVPGYTGYYSGGDGIDRRRGNLGGMGDGIGG